uniref:Uncharacterized protein n=1 Tax=Periophthalmus magnuspinnatus TaxID=409849 RepID=A0A3B4A9R1_9GOBI
MAAVDRRMPNLDDFVGLNWSCWVDTVDIEPSDDMPIYGYCPAQDDFYLVVCSHCGKLVKPQAFEEHCSQRHKMLFFNEGISQPEKCPHVEYYINIGHLHNMTFV